MPFLVARLARLVRVRLEGWRLPLAVAVVVFLTSWAAMALVEPAGTGIATPGTYWWYFVVTAATVGYGDVFPESTAGRLVGAYVIVGGIVTLTLLFTQLSAALQSVRGKRLRGLVDLDLADHVVLFGYTPGRTARIVAELTAEGRAQVVLCASDDVPEDPLPERLDVHFVRGDLTSPDVIGRADVARARTAVIDVGDDNEALAVALAVTHANPDVHLVAALRDLGRLDTLRYVHPEVQGVQWHMPYLLTEEATDPGIAQVYSDLMTSGGHGNTYSARVPTGFAQRTFGDCQTWFGRTFGATVIALRTDRLVVSPGWDTPVPEGATLYYVASRRIEAARLAGGR
ncbi:voltage-gated potassium channel [Geodermatophilus pulveris]|uniref:Voltage-gated potassium channel n=1 Tax=Geodermatophilus pulveris TaxID=1564159 RepID=A0A239EEK6_9ACTN|nr:NAD-binding protein [Geodermatophilus pulveris]SNS42344.1 voltage-gated potassium channel [Geodermatophilus pulveris]